jgi:DNA transformation protein
MAISESYLAFVEEQMAPFAEITSRRMFGGVGLYADGLFFALIADNVLYFKVDDTNRSDFEGAGMAPFEPFGDGKVMQYYQVPAEVIEDLAVLQPWMEKAVAIARRKKKR